MAMRTAKDIASTAKVSGGGVEKVGRARKRVSARTAPPSSIAAVAPPRDWPDFTSDTSSSSSDQTEEGADGRSLDQASSHQDLCLACPYAELNSIVAKQPFRDSSDMGRPRCWSKSYPNIPRLKQHLYRVHRRMTRAQEKRIRRKTRGIPPEANWFAIWEILFTGQDPPRSPYFEDQVPLNLWDSALAADRRRLSAKIKDRLRGALRLTQLQQDILDQTVQQAVAECSGDMLSGVAQNQTPSSGIGRDGAPAGFVDRNTPSTAESAQHGGEWQAWSPSMMQRCLPRSMLIPGTTFSPLSTEPYLSLGPPPIVQPVTNYLGQQQVQDCGDLFLGIYLNSDASPFDDTEYYQWPATAMSTSRET